MVKLSVVKPEGLDPWEKDMFDHADYFECVKFDYTYKSAVNQYNYAHTGCSKNNQFSGKVISPEDWEQLTTDIRKVVGDQNMRNIKVQVYYWAYDPHEIGHLSTGYTFSNGGRIIAYAVWDRANLSGEMVTRITDDGYIIG
jgi:hypothetical protein